MKPQILYVSEHDGRWEVRRCGRPLAIEDLFEDALKAARRLAVSASAGGVPAELRIGYAGANYEVEGVYTT
jgi:hypothetical protein